MGALTAKGMCTCCPMRKRQPLVPVGDLRVCAVCDGGALDIVLKRQAK